MHEVTRGPGGRWLGSGNPQGRPKKTRLLADVLEEKADVNRLAESLLNLAYGGDFPALRYVFDRLCGTPRQSLEVTAGDTEGLGAKLRGLMAV